jgi:hypothetical protein
MVIEPDDHDVVAAHRKFDAQIWQLGNVSPEHDWTTALDLGAYPAPPLGGIISNPLLGRCAKPTRQIQLELSATANQVQGWEKAYRAHIGETERAAESEHQTFAGRAVPSESGPLQQVSQSAGPTVPTDPMRVGRHLCGGMTSSHEAVFRIRACVSDGDR